MSETNIRGLEVTLPSDREIVMTRVFDAPRRLVFDAWTKPEHLMRWLGRRGDTLTVCEVDLRVGGAWRFVWRLSEGGDMGMRGVYREIAAPERLVNTEVFDMWPDIESVCTLVLEEREDKTVLTSSSVYPSKEARDGMLAGGRMEEGAGESFDRLDEHLKAMS